MTVKMLHNEFWRKRKEERGKKKERRILKSFILKYSCERDGSGALAVARHKTISSLEIALCLAMAKREQTARRRPNDFLGYIKIFGRGFAQIVCTKKPNLFRLGWWQFYAKKSTILVLLAFGFGRATNIWFVWPSRTSQEPWLGLKPWHRSVQKWWSRPVVPRK